MNSYSELDDRHVMSGEALRVLDHGFVRVVDTMGDDNAVVQAARVSYGKGAKTAREDAELINYLLRHKHTTPFEMCEIKLHIKLPIFIARQWIRHRTANVNEYSCRYSQVPEQIYMPEFERIQVQSTTNKQGSGDAADTITAQQWGNTTTTVQNVSAQALQYGEKHGVAKELNRINMTVAHYTEWYWKIDAHNLMNFLRLRLDSHAQYEIRAYAAVIARIFQAWLPVTYAAFMEYVFHSMAFSLKEQEVLAPIAHGLFEAIKRDGGAAPATFTAGEWKEFLKKLEELGGLTLENSVA